MPAPSPLNFDTIAAIATPEGEAGLAIVRVSGERAGDIAQRLFRSRALGKSPRSHRVYHGRIHACDSSEILDESLMIFMRGPRSYTAEDVVEFQCHGGRVTARRVLEACYEAGARPAQPGEFTRRAFLNGRLSLDQAEAVVDLIHAENALCAGAALNQLQGGLRRELEQIDAPLLALLARLEGGLEFADEEIDALPREDIVAQLKSSIRQIEELLKLAVAGRLLREGIQVVLVGRPNAGKSSLFNALLGHERTIVDAEAGTTRDYVSEKLHLDGYLFYLFDTAGLRSAPGRVEARGVEITRELIEQADIILELDVSQAIHEMNPHGVRLPIAAKADLLDTLQREDARARGAIPVSAKTCEGLDELRDLLVRTAAAHRLDEAAGAGVVLNDRHVHKLHRASRELGMILAAVETDGAGEDVVATLLASTLAELGELTGRVFSETLLGEIFSRLCIGK